MSSNTPIDDVDLGGVDLMAAEYVLGLLDIDARRAAQGLLESSPAFASDVALWEAHFSPWLESIAPVSVPASLWPRIRTTLWQHELPSRQPSSELQPGKAGRPSLLESLGFWRGLAAGGFAVAVASVAALLLTTRQLPVAAPTPAPVVVATPASVPMVVSLRHDDGSTAYTATVDPIHGTIILVPIHLGGDQSLSPELWMIPTGDHPYSLGMIERGKAMVVSIPASLRSASTGALFAVSLEPAGSHAHVSATGPVIAKGQVIQL
ncbi:MAG: anti-sigma factor [Lysobacteraceae bacterium]